MPKVSVPEYKLHRPTGCAYVRVRGRVFSLGKHGSPESLERYRRILAELAASPSAAAAPVAMQQSAVIEVLAAYLEYATGYYRKPDGSPSGWMAHIKLMIKALKKLYGTTPAAEFGPLAMKAVRQTLIEKGHSRRYINKLMGIVPRIFKWAASEQLVPGATYHDLRTVEGLRKGRSPVRETDPVLPVADAVVDATLPHLPAVVADMVRLQRLTGMRPGEVCQLLPGDVDRSGAVWTYRPGHHKTEHLGRDRMIYIGPKAQDVLRPYLLRAADAYCFSPAESELSRKEEMRAYRKTRVQPSQLNRRKRNPKRKPKEYYTRDSYRRAITRGCEIAFGMPQELRRIPARNPDGTAVPEESKKRLVALAQQWRNKYTWHPNQLRHTAATEIRREYGLEAAQVVLGHATADITQVYAERDSKLAVQVMSKIG